MRRSVLRSAAFAALCSLPQAAQAQGPVDFNAEAFVRASPPRRVFDTRRAGGGMVSAFVGHR
jgi:hypothetical protein